ncbi:MAG: isochorismatase family protein [Gammaproteobacteria bacterium]
MLPAEIVDDRELSCTEPALLLLDLQRDFYHPDGYFQKCGAIKVPQEQRDSILARIKGLCEGMRRAGRPIVYVNTVLRPDHADRSFSPVLGDAFLRAQGAYLVDGSWGAEVVDQLRPQSQDFVVSKRGASAFQHTHLDRLLSNLRISTCVMVGGGVPGSLPASNRQGAALGYEMVLATDALHPNEARYLGSLGARAWRLGTDEYLQLLSSSRPERRPSEGNKFALILIDIQHDSVEPEGAMHRFGYGSGLTDEQRSMAIRNNQKLLAAMRNLGFPIIYTRSVRRLDKLDFAGAKHFWRANPKLFNFPFVVEGDWGSQILEEITPQNGDFVLAKTSHSVFGSTHLHRLLRNLGVRKCIVTGGGIRGCVDETVEEGVGLGHQFIIVSDATFAPNSPHLQLLADWAEIKSTEEVLALLPNQQVDNRCSISL